MSKVRVVHWLGASSINHDGQTACGLLATHWIAEGEYAVLDHETIKAVKRS